MRYFLLLGSLLGIIFFCSCADAIDTGVLPTDKVTLIKSSFKQVMPWNGGTFPVEVEVHTPGNSWSARVNIDQVQWQLVEYSGTKADMVIPANITEQERLVTVEIMSEKKWVAIAQAPQSSGIVEVKGTKWVRGNLTVLNGKFAFTAPEEYGLLFKHNTLHGVSSDSKSYSGVAFTPEQTTIEWSAITADMGQDPCRKVEPVNRWCMPTLKQLSDLCDVSGAMVDEGLFQGEYFADDKLFFPAAGTRDIITAELESQRTKGVYWGSGVNAQGEGEMLSFSLADDGVAKVDYNTTGNLGSVRCIKMDNIVDYISHTPLTDATKAAFDLTVTCKSNMPTFIVRVVGGVDNELDLKQQVSMEDPVATFAIATNESTSARILKIIVNGVYTGKRVTQAGLSDYARYIERSPASKMVPGDAFNLSVTCASDLETFDVKLYSADKSVDLTQKGSKKSVIVRFDVPPNNSGASRELLLSVNGVAVDDNIVQEHKPASYGDVVIDNTTWAKGNIILSAGNFVIGSPKDRGLFFMANSIYGISSNDAKYSGTAYTPTAQYLPWQDIPYNNGGDPCSLLVSDDKWRLPTQAEITRLKDVAVSRYTLDGVSGYNYAGNNLFIPASGYIFWNGTEASQSNPTLNYGYIRSNSDYVTGFEANGVFVSVLGQGVGYPVRCVKKVNFAEYISHTPNVEQTGAFTLKVSFMSDMASVPVRIVGGSLDIIKSANGAEGVASFDIPNNESGATRELKIFVNDIYTNRSVQQTHLEVQEPGLVWAEGNLAIVDNEYVIGSKTERGWLFCNMSIYGVPYSGIEYGGNVFAPTKQSMSWASIPFGDTDPCTLVKPVNTWRMPSQQECSALIDGGSAVATESGVDGRLFTTGNVFLVGSTGSFKDTDGSVLMVTTARYWTSTASPTATKRFLLQFGSTSTSKVTATLTAEAKTAMAVRCVK